MMSPSRWKPRRTRLLLTDKGYFVQLKNTNKSFGFVSKSFHWVMAIIVLALLSVGFLMTAMGFSPLKLSVYTLHKSFGVLVLILVMGRAGWRLASPRPDALP